MLGSNDDISLWENFRKGDKSSFSFIYKKYAPALLSYGAKITADSELLQDCVHDLFVEIWNSRERLSTTTSIKFYLFKALRLKVYRHLKNSAGHETAIGLLWLEESSSPENFLIQKESELLKARRLRDQLSKLPLRQQEAITLRYFNGFSNEEVALIMGISYNSASKTIYAGLKTLRESLKEAFIPFF